MLHVINLFNPPNKSVTLISLVCGWENGSLEKFNHLPKVTCHPENGGLRICRGAVWLANCKKLCWTLSYRDSLHTVLARSHLGKVNFLLRQSFAFYLQNKMLLRASPNLPGGKWDYVTIPYKCYISGQVSVITKELESLIIRGVLWALASIAISTGKVEFKFQWDKSMMRSFWQPPGLRLGRCKLKEAPSSR